MHVELKNLILYRFLVIQLLHGIVPASSDSKKAPSPTVIDGVQIVPIRVSAAILNVLKPIIHLLQRSNAQTYIQGLGKDVRGFQPGDRVAVPFITSCPWHLNYHFHWSDRVARQAFPANLVVDSKTHAIQAILPLPIHPLPLRRPLRQRRKAAGCVAPTN